MDCHAPFIDDYLPEDDGVLHQWEEHEEHASEQPDLQGSDRVGDRDPCGGGVEHVYQDKTQSDQQDNSGRDDILEIQQEIQQQHFFISYDPHRRYEEGDPAHSDEHSRRQVDTENEGPDGSRQLDLKSVHAVVAW